MSPKKSRISMLRKWAINTQRNRQMPIIWKVTGAADNRSKAQIINVAIRAGAYAPGFGRVHRIPESLKWMAA